MNPAATFIMGNIYPNEKRATTLKRCRDLDTEIRKRLVDHRVKGRTTSNARVREKGGLGLRTIKLETELQYVRRGIYLHMHSDMGAALKTYRALKKASWRNPISDREYVMEQYGSSILLSSMLVVETAME